MTRDRNTRETTDYNSKFIELSLNKRVRFSNPSDNLYGTIGTFVGKTNSGARVVIEIPSASDNEAETSETVTRSIKNVEADDSDGPPVRVYNHNYRPADDSSDGTIDLTDPY